MTSPRLSDRELDKAQKLWALGWGTLDIAIHMGEPEASIYNSLIGLGRTQKWPKALLQRTRL